MTLVLLALTVPGITLLIWFFTRDPRPRHFRPPKAPKYPNWEDWLILVVLAIALMFGLAALCT